MLQFWNVLGLLVVLLFIIHNDVVMFVEISLVDLVSDCVIDFSPANLFPSRIVLWEENWISLEFVSMPSRSSNFDFVGFHLRIREVRFSTRRCVFSWRFPFTETCPILTVDSFRQCNSDWSTFVHRALLNASKDQTWNFSFGKFFDSPKGCPFQFFTLSSTWTWFTF